MKKTNVFCKLCNAKMNFVKTLSLARYTLHRFHCNECNNEETVQTTCRYNKFLDNQEYIINQIIKYEKANKLDSFEESRPRRLLL